MPLLSSSCFIASVDMVSVAVRIRTKALSITSRPDNNRSCANISIINKCVAEAYMSSMDEPVILSTNNSPWGPSTASL